MPLDLDVLYTCPSCADENAMASTSGGHRQHLVEDCPVCCRPLVFDVIVDSECDAIIQRVEVE